MLSTVMHSSLLPPPLPVWNCANCWGDAAHSTRPTGQWVWGTHVTYHTGIHTHVRSFGSIPRRNCVLSEYVEPESSGDLFILKPGLLLFIQTALSPLYIWNYYLRTGKRGEEGGGGALWGILHTVNSVPRYTVSYTLSHPAGQRLQYTVVPQTATAHNSFIHCAPSSLLAHCWLCAICKTLYWTRTIPIRMTNVGVKQLPTNYCAK